MIRRRLFTRAIQLSLLLLVAPPTWASAEGEVAFHRGIAAYADGRLDDARKAFETVVDADPRDAEALQYLGLIAQDQGRPFDAIVFYERMLSIDEDDLDARFDLATALLESGQPEKARTQFEYVIELEPEYARAFYFAGVAAYRNEQYSLAVRYMDRAVELDSSLRTEASYYTGLAEAYQGNLTLADAALDVVGQSPQSPLADSAANMQQRLRPPPAARRWSLALTGGVEFDSNPTLAGGGVELAGVFDEVDEQPDARFIARLRASFRAIQTERFAASVGYDGYLGVHTDVSEVDLQTHVGFLTAGWDLDPVRLNLRYDFAYTWLDLTDSFRLLNRVTPTVSLREQEWGLTQVYYQFDHADFDTAALGNDLSPSVERVARRLVQGRDSLRHAVGLKQYVFVEPVELLDYVLLGVAGDLTDADRSEFSYQAWEVSGGFGLALPLDAELAALYRYVRRNYQGRNSFDGPGQARRRDDHIQLISLDLGVPIGEHWRVSVGSSAAFNASDVGFFDYNRFVTGGYLTYRF